MLSVSCADFFLIHLVNRSRRFHMHRFEAAYHHEKPIRRYPSDYKRFFRPRNDGFAGWRLYNHRFQYWWHTRCHIPACEAPKGLPRIFPIGRGSPCCRTHNCVPIYRARRRHATALFLHYKGIDLRKVRIRYDGSSESKP